MIAAPRTVRFSTIINLIKQRRGLALAGIIMTVMPLLMTLLIVSISSAITGDEPVVNYQNVDKNGKITTGTITDIQTKLNVTVNGAHPSVIIYKYQSSSQEVESRYETLSPEQVSKLNVGDEIEIKYLGNESIIPSLPPFSFPFIYFYATFGVLFLIGISFSAYVFAKVSAEVVLYKYGKALNAQILYLLLKPGARISTSGVNVVYQYATSAGQKIQGEVVTKDPGMVADKKQGDAIRILVSPEDESKSCLFPAYEALRNNWEEKS